MHYIYQTYCGCADTKGRFVTEARHIKGPFFIEAPNKGQYSAEVRQLWCNTCMHIYWNTQTCNIMFIWTKYILKVHIFHKFVPISRVYFLARFRAIVQNILEYTF